MTTATIASPRSETRTSVPALEAQGVSRRYPRVAALEDASFRIEGPGIYGLLGRNGAGKTTLMQLLTGQDFPSEGEVRVLGETPAEHSAVLQQMCFIKESQKYPDSWKPKHVLRAGPMFFGNWDAAYAARLVAEFRLPTDRVITKLSRGQLSALGVIIGLASRAPITFFDEPYLGLDAVARQIFYDRLLEDQAEHPRVVVLSTHLIDEVSALLEHVIVLDNGRIILDEEADALRGSATAIAGRAATLDAFIAGRDVLHRSSIGALATATVRGALSPVERQQAAEAGLELAPVPLQQLIVDLSRSAESAADSTTPEQ